MLLRKTMQSSQTCNSVRGRLVEFKMHKYQNCLLRCGKRFACLHEKDVSGGISASMDNKCLLLDVTASTGPDGQLAAVLKTSVHQRKLEKTDQEF